MSYAYYNEVEPDLVEFLKLAIRKGHLPQGEVDGRSIVDVQPDDLRGFTHCHFFAGSGGWALATRLARWPVWRPLWTASLPCQPYSVAGLGGGDDDPRNLRPQFLRLVAKCRPPTVGGEQVASPAGRAWLAALRLSLEALGYAFGAADLCAAGIGAIHIRQRGWWIADAEWNEQSREKSRCGSPGRMGRVEQSVPWNTPWSSALPQLRVLDDGLPRCVAATDAARNAIVPELGAEWLAAFLDTEAA